MGVKNEDCQKEADRKKEPELGALPIEKRCRRGKDCGRGEGGEGQDAACEEDDPPDPESNPGRAGRRGEKNPERRGNALAALEAEPDREAVARNRTNAEREPEAHSCGIAGENGRRADGEIPFQGVEKEDENPPFFSDDAEDIRGADIFAAVPAEVNALDFACDEQTKGN